MAFDPYESWLGITADDRPPTYYHLLGLSPFESDPQIIEQAALRRMSKVRQHQIGPHSDSSQEILAELARARLVLIDSDRRADYDAKLRAAGASRPDLSAAVAKNVIADAANAASVPSLDGLDILAKLRISNESRPGLSVATDRNLAGDASRRVTASVEGGLDLLASIATQGSDGSLSVRSTKKKRPALWKNRLFVASFLSSHVAIIAVFFVFGSAIALYVRSIFVRDDPAARAAAQNPNSPDAWPATTGPRPNPIDDNRSAPTTWLRFERGTRITVAKSDDFDISEHDFTIFARIKTGKGGTLFSKAPAAGGWATGARRLLIRNGSLAFEIRGGPRIETAGRQVDDELWHEVAVTYASQDGQLFLFVDGNRHGPRIIAPTRDVTGHVVRIGSVARDDAANENEHFAGLIAEVRFYQRALTTAEIAGLPSQEPGGKPPLAQWKLREGGSRLVRDQTGHGHGGRLDDGTVSSAAVPSADEEEVAKLGSPSSSKDARPTKGSPPPDGADRGGREFLGNSVQAETKADNSPEGILKKHGLKAKGDIYVLETEDAVQTKVTESLLLTGKMQYHRMQKQAAMDAAVCPKMIHELELRIAQYQAAIQMADQNIKEIPRFGGRFYNNLDEALFNELTANKSRLQEELGQANGSLKDLKSQPSNAQWNQATEEAAKADQKLYDQALRESRELVDATKRRIDELKKNEEIKKALVAWGKGTHKKTIKLGPSPEFEKNVVELEKLERDGKRGVKRGK